MIIHLSEIRSGVIPITNHHSSDGKRREVVVMQILYDTITISLSNPISLSHAHGVLRYHHIPKHPPSRVAP